MNRYTVHAVVNDKDVSEHVLAWNEYGAENKVIAKYESQGKQVFVIWVERGWK